MPRYSGLSGYRRAPSLWTAAKTGRKKSALKLKYLPVPCWKISPGGDLKSTPADGDLWQCRRFLSCRTGKSTARTGVRLDARDAICTPGHQRGLKNTLRQIVLVRLIPLLAHRCHLAHTSPPFSLPQLSPHHRRHRGSARLRDSLRVASGQVSRGSARGCGQTPVSRPPNCHGPPGSSRLRWMNPCQVFRSNSALCT